MSKITLSNGIDLNPIIDQSWVAATYTRNYVVKDPILDWLNLYGTKKGFKKDSEENSELQNKLNFTTYIMKKGQEFETYICNILKQKCGENFIEVYGNNKVYPIQKRYILNIKNTYSLMERGVKVIYQGMVFNPRHKTFGFPDLIVRSDYINELFGKRVLSDKQINRGCRFSDKWHYRIIDIKYFCMKLNEDDTIRTSSSQSVICYKIQNYIYNNALGYMQHFIPKHTYILGRGYYDDELKIMNPFYVAGKFDFSDEDCSLSNDAIDWIRKVRTEGLGWDVFTDNGKPSVSELYPNMSNTMDYDWHNTKHKISTKLAEITSLWQCGVKNRDFAHSLNVFRWDDFMCNSYNLNITGKHSHNLDCIISINRPTNNSIYHIDKARLCDYKFSGSYFFVDFENIYNIDDVTGKGEDVLFLIGCGHSSETENWVFSNFCVDKLTKIEEKRMLENFIVYLQQQSIDRKCVLFHYNHTEPTLFLKLVKYHDIKVDIEIRWIDILDILKECHFAIKDTFDYSLKNIMNSLFKYNFSDVSYTNGTGAKEIVNVYNGLEAMVAAIIANRESENGNFNKHPFITNIKIYNEIDCKSLKSLWGFLKKLTL